MPAALPDRELLKEKFVQLVLETGEESEALDRLKLKRSTVAYWKKTDSTFLMDIRRAKKDNEIIYKRNIIPSQVKALHGMEQLLEPQKKKKVIHTRKVIIDEETGKELKLVELKTQTIEYEEGPDVNMIKKVLGDGDLLYFSIGRAHNPTGETSPITQELQKELLGEEFANHPQIKNDPRVTKYIMGDTMDLVRLRILNIYTQRAYDNRQITLSEYSKLTTEQTKLVATLRNSMEARAQKLLKNMSYEKIIEELNVYTDILLQIIHEVAVDETIKRKDIAERVRVRAWNRIRTATKLNEAIKHGQDITESKSKEI